MQKIAIFVEGQAERVFVREFLLKLYEYTDIHIECFRLHGASMQTAKFNFINDKANYKFHIIQVGGDNVLLTRILEREVFLWEQGFTKIVGLRDMYSKAYRESCKGRNISSNLNQQFIDGLNNTINLKAERPDNVMVCFSIMEVETWILGMLDTLEAIHPNLNAEELSVQLDYNVHEVDPEKYIFHPASVLTEILNQVDIAYTKKEKHIESLCGAMEVIHYKNLYATKKCSSFNIFCDFMGLQLETS